jgi:hypothetical protein
MKKLVDYSEKKLIKEIKLQGAIIIIFTVTIILFGSVLVYDIIQGNEIEYTMLFAFIAVAAGITSTYMQRKKKKEELVSRNMHNDD